MVASAVAHHQPEYQQIEKVNKKVICNVANTVCLLALILAVVSS